MGLKERLEKDFPDKSSFVTEITRGVKEEIVNENKIFQDKLTELENKVQNLLELVQTLKK